MWMKPQMFLLYAHEKAFSYEIIWLLVLLEYSLRQQLPKVNEICCLIDQILDI